MKRVYSRCVQGAVLALGAPAGWLSIQAMRGVSPLDALAADFGLYAYLTAATGVVFAFFGMLLGHREDRLVELNRRLDELAVTDPLTGLRNRRYFEARLEEEAAHCRRAREPLALAIVDLDHFKQINDRYGHAAGDEVLKSAADAIHSITRHGETGARIGGEEFALLLPGSTGEEAREVAERVRFAIGERLTRPSDAEGATLRVTASVGVASTAELTSADPEQLFRAADEALYGAKAAGRNRTAVARAPPRAA